MCFRDDEFASEVQMQTSVRLVNELLMAVIEHL